jgi:hypothetical protein
MKYITSVGISNYPSGLSNINSALFVHSLCIICAIIAQSVHSNCTVNTYQTPF